MVNATTSMTYLLISTLIEEKYLDEACPCSHAAINMWIDMLMQHQVQFC